ncbi:MAG: MgtC/SapB family protein [Nitrospinae bacterium]|nr:MgtC/SapB family protein [Nitrospinota bacterium]
MLEEVFSIYPLTWDAIACCMLSGLIIGLERQFLGKPVGVRTSMLVCVGTYVFLSISNSVTEDSGFTDPSRVIGQVVTGIGFLGAGVMLSRDGLVYGVTSASTIWGLAAIGVTIASGYEMTGVKIALLAVIILVGVDLAEDAWKFMQKGVHKKLKSKLKKPDTGE